MKVVIAIDSFKGSLTSLEAGNAAADGILRALPDAETIVVPIADGGEGTVDALVQGMNGNIREITVTDPLGRPVSAQYGVIEDTAVIEMSAAAGITLLKEDELDPMNTTTYGVGEIIRDAIGIGCREFIIGIGGSATNDGGIGMLQALGFDMLDRNGDQVSYGAKGVSELAQIAITGSIPELNECKFFIASDVTNPLCGINGCSMIYGPQKGATPEQITDMDNWLAHYSTLTKKLYPDADSDYPGAGAAGGIGFAFETYLNATLEPGIDFILDKTGLSGYLPDADIVITGEGRLDGQTVMGKAPIGVARKAKEFGKPVIAFAGSIGNDAIACNDNGIDAFFPILRKVCSIDDALDKETAKKNMADTVEQVFRMIVVFF